MNVNELQNLLKENGFKMTKYRKSLLEFLVDESRPISVGDILERFFKKNLVPNKTTVYREVSILVGLGIVKELDLGDGCKRYELFDIVHHHHLICENCKSIEDVVIDENLKSIEKKISIDKKFVVKNHLLEFYGLCENCC